MSIFYVYSLLFVIVIPILSSIQGDKSKPKAACKKPIKTLYNGNGFGESRFGYAVKENRD
jgi:hypothetical protein